MKPGPPGRARRALRLVLVNGLAGQYWFPKRLRLALYRAVGFRVGDCTVFSNVIIRTNDLTIGSGSFVNHGCSFDQGAITLGHNVYLGVNVVLASGDHTMGPSTKRAGHDRSAPIVIEDGVWIGAGSVVLGGIRVRSGCVIGAGAVVTRDTEPDGVYVGVPAKRARDLPDD